MGPCNHRSFLCFLKNVADVLTYIRNSWGNAAPAVTASEVKTLRKALAR
ncbi:hypothetical protein [Tatumella terrea]|uniref:Uncharacterized protein n=1 Tax=Tatumella terrea TaxID=419007 RepID=A0ABW1W2Q0_9GAMM